MAKVIIKMPPRKSAPVAITSASTTLGPVRRVPFRVRVRGLAG
jgi:hypothetical protein